MSAYLRSTHAAAAEVYGARVVSLAGGCYGLAVRLGDGTTLLMARSPDLGYSVEYATWAAWLEDDRGEIVAPIAGDPLGAADLGYVRPRDYAHMVPLALRRIRDAAPDEVPA